jgi:tRNA(Arg) A34 adenosine deaminase TadA
MQVKSIYKQSIDRDTYKVKPLDDKHLRFFNYAINEAKKSELINKHGCIIVKNGIIISQGHNIRYNLLSDFKSIHAELMAINKIKFIRDLSNCEMYVVRLSENTGELMFSKPCILCTPIIKRYKISKIYYSY